MSRILNPNSLDAYDYELPPELIANFPTFPKEDARLLVYERASEKISHLKFGDLPEILPPCDIIFNDTKVVKARIFGKHALIPAFIILGVASFDVRRQRHVTDAR